MILQLYQAEEQWNYFLLFFKIYYVFRTGQFWIKQIYNTKTVKMYFL